ncbi:MAG: hypothetical protein RML12_10110 [Xanthomonadales bacterium]|nr:hypothetical protein [Xanthomonadales bacterium]
MLASALAAGPVPVDFTPQGTQPGLAAPLEDPLACSSCHGVSEGQADAAWLASTSWAGSMKANAARDPLFWAALDVAERDVPGVGDWCLRCHAPAGWLAGRVRKTGHGAPPLVNGTNGCLLSGSLIAADGPDNDFAGVTCHLCHRAQERGPLGQPQIIGQGALWLDDSLSCVTPLGSFFGPCRKGPYDYPAGGPVMPPPHGWEKDGFLGSGHFCGSCHDVTSPITSAGPLKTLILPDGTDSGIPFPLERTFSEWLRSDFGATVFRDGFGSEAPERIALPRGQTCQSCHLRNEQDPSARACNFELPGSRRGELPVHEFAGANTWIPRILRDVYGLGREQAFDRTIAWAERMLKQESATLSASVHSFSGIPGTLRIRVRVTNLSGHKLPTGYAEGRRMWLWLRVRDAASQLIFESGGWNPATGELASDPQLKVYEAVQGIWNRNGQNRCDAEDGSGRKLFHFALNNCIVKDNRIPPRGFTGGGDPELRPVAATFPEVSPGVLAHWDDTEYLVSVPGGAQPPLTIEVRLRYQVASKEYIEFLRDEAVQGGFPSENALCGRNLGFGPAHQSRGAFMYQLWSDHGRSPPEDMAVLSLLGEPLMRAILPLALLLAGCAARLRTLRRARARSGMAAASSRCGSISSSTRRTARTAGAGWRSCGTTAPACCAGATATSKAG